MTAVEWADENFYLSAESSYVEGRWKTLHFQIAILNAMGNDEIREVNLMKSARVGYSQMLKAAMAYMLEHKNRNQLLFQPTDSAAASFMKAHIETMIRDVPVIKALAPWLGKKHRDNTLDTKKFDNKRQIWCFGGTAAKNYREKSVDTVIYDELAAFPPDVEKEGSPTFLGDRRLEGSVYGKSIRGSTPKNKDECQIERAFIESKMRLQYEVPCPHCGKMQALKWGGPDAEFGIKWINDDPKTVAYLCEECGCLGTYAEWFALMDDGIWVDRDRGIQTKDGLDWFDLEGKEIETPEAVSFHVWSAYSPFTDWSRLVKDWQKTKDDIGKLKTFVNTVLGETWEDETGDKIEPELLYARREYYPAEIPVENCVLTCAIDTQDDRFEIEVVAWTAGEESYRISYERLYGDLSRSEIWNLLSKRVKRQFVTPSGTLLNIKLCTIDSGGHYTDEVYQWCKKNGPHNYIPIKGSSETGKPVAKYPRKRNEKGVYLTIIGPDTAKEIICSRLRILEHGEGFMHYPAIDEFDEDYFKQLTAEKKKRKLVKGRWQTVWDAGGRRNEPFDTSVYNLAAIRILQQHRALNLTTYINSKDQKAFAQTEEANKPESAPQRPANSNSNFINTEGSWL